MRELGFFIALSYFLAGVGIGYLFQIWIIVVITSAYMWLLIETLAMKSSNLTPGVVYFLIGCNRFMAGMWSMAVIMRWDCVMNMALSLNPALQSTKEFFKNYVLR